jgi:hypothetical protein
VWLYNQHLPQKVLNHQTPLMAMKSGSNHIPTYSPKESSVIRDLTSNTLGR